MTGTSTLDKVSSHIHLVPQATINVASSVIADRYGHVLEEGVDDFDSFLSVTFCLDGEIPVGLVHYRGYPQDEWSVHLPSEIHQIDRITGLIERIVSELGLPSDAIVWQRRDNPEL